LEKGRLPTARVKNANPVSGRGWLLLAAVLAFGGCAKPAPEKVASIPPLPVTPGTAPGYYTYEVVRTFPHDRKAFTQGLVFRNGNLFESTGLNGESSLREVELTTGRVLKQVSVPRQYFAEGVALLGSRAYQLTWQNQRGFIYDGDTFEKLGEFEYPGEGWGLATDGQVLILSNGTNRIFFLDPKSFQPRRVIDVKAADGKPVDRLNELEFINGEIFANVWQTDNVVRIGLDGLVRGIVDFSGLLGPGDRQPETDVLNGIAYDAEHDRLFITGKRWPKIFEVRLKAKP
jgi:glutamine cyclotransferase